MVGIWDDEDEVQVRLQTEHTATGGSSSSMPYASGTSRTPHATTRLGFATRYDPDTDPWHDEGVLDHTEIIGNTMGATPSGHQHHQQQQPPQPPLQQGHPPPALPQQPPLPLPVQQQRQAQLPAQHRDAYPPVKQPPPRPPQHAQQPGGSQYASWDSWASLARTLANDGPLLPPSQWSHNAVGQQQQPVITDEAPRPTQAATEGTRPPPDETDVTPASQPQRAVSQQVPHEHPPDLPARDPHCAQPLRPRQPQQDPAEQPPAGTSPHSDELENSACGDVTSPQPDHTSTTCDDPALGNPSPHVEPALTEPIQPEQDEDDEWIEIHDDAEGAPPDEEDGDGWISDVSDTDEEDEEDTPPATSQPHLPQAQGTGGNPRPTKRQAGHGSQRVKNKARKSDVKKLWQEAGWEPKPTWLTWKAALQWLQRGEQPPRKQPVSTPAERAKFAALLAAHQYVRDDKGNIIPSTSSTASSSSTRPSPSMTQVRTPPEQQPHQRPGDPSTGDKAATQARLDHQQRMATNPYRSQPHSVPQPRQTHRGDPPHQEQQHPPQQHISSTTGERRVSFSLPDGRRENPPKPVRTEHVLRRLSDSSPTQLQLDGTSNNPLQVVDNRPDYIRSQGGNPITQRGTASSQSSQAGDVLFTQPPHLTATATTPSSSARGQPMQPDISDLEDQANVAVQQGNAPRWEIEDDTNSMRSSIRIGEVTFDISWLQGAGPPTLSPTIPIAPNVVFSARGTVAGSWRGVLWTPEQHEIIRHPPRTRRSHEWWRTKHKVRHGGWDLRYLRGSPSPCTPWANGSR